MLRRNLFLSNMQSLVLTDHLPQFLSFFHMTVLQLIEGIFFFLVSFPSSLPILLFPGYTSGYLYGPVLNVLSISVTLLRLPISKHRSLRLHEPLPALFNALCMSPNLLCSETGRKGSSLTSLLPFINSQPL